MNDRLKLALQFDPVLLQRDLKNVDTPEWVDHFVPAHYEGTWSVLPLRSPASARHPIQMIYSDPSCEDWVDTPLLAKCPHVQEILAGLLCPLRSVRLMKLSAGSVIKPHKDYDLDAESGHVRLHIPVVTNPDVDFLLNGTRVVMGEGECWYLRLSDTHEVANRGTTDRVHLVIDTLMSPWLAGQLALAEASAPVLPDTHTHTPQPAGAQSGPAEGWVPCGLRTDGPAPVVEWCYLGATTFSDPFFEQTIVRTRSRADQPKPRYTPVDALLEWQVTHPGVPPTAFIFHVSRCGSTLFSRLAAALPTAIAISEAIVIDQVLRAPVPESRRIEWLRALVSALGQPRRGGEQHLFIKFDAWHVAQAALIQAAFPGVPCVFLYREPSAVLASQVRMPAMFMILGAPEAAMFSPDPHEGSPLEREEQIARVLGAAYANGGRLAAAGQLTLINYADLPEAACAHLLKWTGQAETADVADAWRPIVLADAKSPTRPFDASPKAQPNQRVRNAAAKYMDGPYAELEAIRQAHWV